MQGFVFISKSVVSIKFACIHKISTNFYTCQRFIKIYLRPQRYVISDRFYRKWFKYGCYFSAGLRCTQQCPEGTWGLQCNLTCSCLNSATCQAHTGICLCKPGFWGAQCQHSKHTVILESLRAQVTLELV